MAMSDSEVVAFLEEHRRHSVGRWMTDIAADQDDLLKRYLQLPYGDEEEGRSQVISSDVAQVVDWALPDIIEPFVSAGQKTTEFRPCGPEDEEAAKQADDYVSFVLWNDNDAFQLAHDCIKDGLIQKRGVIKVRLDQAKRGVTEEETLWGKSIHDLQVLSLDDKVRILNVEQIPLNIANQPELLTTYPDGAAYTVRVRRDVSEDRIRAESLAIEDFRITNRSISIEQAPYCAHYYRETIGALLDMGWDEEKLRDAHDAETEHQKTRRDTRFASEPRREFQQEGVGQDWTRREVTVMEEYARVDWDGNGADQIIMSNRVGTTIFPAVPDSDGPVVVPCKPFVSWCPFPITHRFFGEGMADKTAQTQRVKTVLTRNMLDNIYLSINPQREVPEDAVTDDGSTYDDLLTFRVGGLIRTKKPGMLREMTVPDMSDTALKGLEYMNTVREEQTGVVRAPQGLSAEAIDQDMTAEQARQVDRGSKKVLRLIARQFAEQVWAPLHTVIYRWTVQYQDRPRVIRLRNKWVEIDPRPWNAEMNAKPIVGLGYPNTESEAASAAAIGNIQERVMPLGLAGPKQIYKTAEDAAAALGRRDASEYFVDPDSPEYQAWQEQQAQASQQPDAAAMRVQQDGQIKAAKLQQDVQLKTIELQQKSALAEAEATMRGQIEMAKLAQQAEGNQAKTAADLQASMAKIESDYRARLEQIDRETALKLEQMNRELALAEEEQDREFALELRKQNLQALTQQHATDTRASLGNGNGLGGDVRMGGRVG